MKRLLLHLDYLTLDNMNRDYKICNCNEVVVFNENEEFKLCPICKALVINMNKTQIIKFDLLKDDTETEEEHVKNDEKINILNQFSEKIIVRTLILK